MQDNAKFYVYALLRPAKVGLGPPAPFYIGKGCGLRVSRHRRAAERENTLRARIARAAIAQCGELPTTIIARQLTEDAAFSLERQLIARFGRIACRTGILANMTDGGEGPSGSRHSTVTREQMSKSQRRANTPEVRRKKADGVRAYCSTSEAKELRAANARKMHATLGADWVAKRNKTNGQARNESNEPLARRARALFRDGMKPYKIASHLSVSCGTAYRFCGPVFDHLDSTEGTEPAPS